MEDMGAKAAGSVVVAADLTDEEEEVIISPSKGINTGITMDSGITMAVPEGTMAIVLRARETAEGVQTSNRPSPNEYQVQPQRVELESSPSRSKKEK